MSEDKKIQPDHEIRPRSNPEINKETIRENRKEEAGNQPQNPFTLPEEAGGR